MNVLHLLQVPLTIFFFLSFLSSIANIFYTVTLAIRYDTRNKISANKVARPLRKNLRQSTSVQSASISCYRARIQWRIGVTFLQRAYRLNAVASTLAVISSARCTKESEKFIRSKCFHLCFVLHDSVL